MTETFTSIKTKINKNISKVIRTGQKYSANQLVASDIVEIHDLDVKGALSDLLPWHVKREGVVEDGIQGTLEDSRLALLNTFVTELQPDFHIRI